MPSTAATAPGFGHGWLGANPVARMTALDGQYVPPMNDCRALADLLRRAGLNEPHDVARMQGQAVDRGPQRRKGIVHGVRQRGHRANDTALADSLEPPSVKCDGVSMWSISMSGTSSIVGSS